MPTTYLREQGFSALVEIKRKKTNLIKDVDPLMKNVFETGLKPHFSQLADEMQREQSPKWDDQRDLSFFSHFKKLRSVTERFPPKNRLKHSQGNCFSFSDNSISSALHGCCSAGSNCLILHPRKSMIFNELIPFGEDGLSSWANSNVKTTQLANVFCFLDGKPTTQNQPNLFWNICCFWAFFSLLRSCFSKSEIWRHLRLVVLLNSGIFPTLETFFFLHGNGCFSSIDNDFLEMLQRMPLTYFDE